jgi:hypothetical protein
MHDKIELSVRRIEQLQECNSSADTDDRRQGRELGEPGSPLSALCFVDLSMVRKSEKLFSQPLAPF